MNRFVVGTRTISVIDRSIPIRYVCKELGLNPQTQINRIRKRYPDGWLTTKVNNRKMVCLKLEFLRPWFESLMSQVTDVTILYPILDQVGNIYKSVEPWVPNEIIRRVYGQQQTYAQVSADLEVPTEQVKDTAATEWDKLVNIFKENEYYIRGPEYCDTDMCDDIKYSAYGRIFNRCSVCGGRAGLKIIKAPGVIRGEEKPSDFTTICSICSPEREANKSLEDVVAELRVMVNQLELVLRNSGVRGIFPSSPPPPPAPVWAGGP